MAFLGKIADTVTGAGHTVVTAVDEKIESAKAEGGVVAEIAMLKARLANAAEEWANEKEKMIEDWKEEKKRMLVGFLAKKVDSIYDYAMNVACEWAKEKVKDPYMCDCVKDLADEMVDGIWPDIKLELKDYVLAKIEDPPEYAHGDTPCCCGGHILAFFRYYIIPYDRGFWRQLWNPLWWLFNLLSLIPKYGIGSITYILWFFLIDKSDEFQLFNYMVDFKGVQFFSLGIISTAVGAIQYYFCVTRSPSDCHEVAPREDVWTMIIFVIQVIFVWMAFFLMSCSQKKGGFYYQYNQQSKDKVKSEVGSKNARSSTYTALLGSDESVTSTLHYQTDAELLDASKGRLRIFLIYDLCVFILCLGLAAWMAFANFLTDDSKVDPNHKETYNNDNWKFTMGLYWIKALYGALSFPFVALRLPLISSLISHAKPTGYNPYGNVVPYIGEEEQRPVPWDLNRRPPDEELQEA